MSVFAHACVCIAFVSASISSATANEVHIVDAKAAPQASGAYRFDVTLEHADTGWDHYADAFIIQTLEGEQLGERILLHPHVNEQPFTRSLNGVTIPEDVCEVEIVARDTVHGLSEQTFLLDLCSN